MRTTIVFALILVVLHIVSAASSHAQAGRVGLYGDTSGITQEVADANGLVQIHAVHTQSPGAIGVQFSAPLPACYTGAIWLSDQPVVPFVFGTSQTGVAVGFGGCLGSPVHMLTINIFSQGTLAECCEYPVLPDPNVPSGQIEIVDCNSNLLFGSGGTATILGPNPNPVISNRLPLDGASAVPLTAHLTWTTDLCVLEGIVIPGCSISFGTDPDPPLVSTFSCTTYDPGPLQPNTTYYWRVGAWDASGNGTQTPVWSFTTEGSVSVRIATWGAIKASMR